MRRTIGALLGAVALVVGAVPASADPVDPNFLSTLNGVTPSPRGLEVKIVNLGDELQVTNETGKELLVAGYTGEPYLRFKPDGTVEENQSSPATYLNKDRYATEKVPDQAGAKARPDWKVVARNGSYEWHDHRIHYMGKGTPRQVEDESVRQKVYDWKLRLEQAGTPITVSGTLFWIPTPGAGDDGGVGGGQIALAAALVALSAAIAFLMIRRRRRPVPAGADGSGVQADDAEETERREQPAKEAW